MISGGAENIPIFFLTFYLTILPIVVTVVIQTRTDTDSIANILVHDASIYMFKPSCNVLTSVLLFCFVFVCVIMCCLSLQPCGHLWERG